MSMSDCDWIIYGPDGTVTVDIGKWTAARERADLDRELSDLRKKVDDLECENEELRIDSQELRDKLAKYENA